MAIPFIPEIKILGRLSGGGHYPGLGSNYGLRARLAEEFRKIISENLPLLKFEHWHVSTDPEFFTRGGCSHRNSLEHMRYNRSVRWHIDASARIFKTVVICNVSDSKIGVSNTQIVASRLTIECPEKPFESCNEIYDIIHKQTRRNKAKRIIDTEDGVIYALNQHTLHRTQVAKASGCRLFMRDYMIEKTQTEIDSEKALLRGDHMKNAKYASSVRFTLHSPEFLRHNKLKAGSLPPPIIDILSS